MYLYAAIAIVISVSLYATRHARAKGAAQQSETSPSPMKGVGGRIHKAARAAICRWLLSPAQCDMARDHRDWSALQQ